MARTRFEHETCSRCGGSGHYSFNLRDGTVCYGCSGRGYRYTKRGAAAAKFYNDLFTVPIQEVQPEDFIWDTWPKGHFRKVSTVNPPKHELTYADGTIFRYDCPDVTVRRRARNEEERLAFLEKALAYQGTLTKAGKPYKRKVTSSFEIQEEV